MFKHYLISAWRNFHRHWITTFVNVIGLTLGLACFIGALSVVKYYQLDDSQYSGSERTYAIGAEYSAMGAPGAPFRSNPPWVLADYLKVQVPNDGVARATFAKSTSITVAGNPSEVRATYADASFLKLFPLPFIVGNRNDALTQPHSAIISNAAAVRVFGRENVVGQTMLIDGRDAVTIVGVTAESPQPSHIGDSESSSTLRFEMLISMDMLRTGNDQTHIPNGHDWGQTVGALAPLTYIRLSNTDLSQLDILKQSLATLSELHPSTANRHFVPYRLPEIREHAFANRVAGSGLSWSVFLVMLASVVLFASCLNYVNLSAAILLSHRKELGVRRVIGASTRQLAMQSLVESTLLTLAATFLSGLLLLTARPILKDLFYLDITYAWSHSIEIWVATLAVLFFVSLLVSFYPTVLIRRSQMAAALRQIRGDTSRHAAARWLVATQFLIASSLLIGIFVVRSQHEAMLAYALNSLPEPIVTINTELKSADVSFDVLRSELLKQPDIASVSGSQFGPWSQSFGLVPVSNSLAAGTSEFPVMSLVVAQDYFSTMNVTRLAGRLLDEISEAPTQNVRVVIDQSTARRLGWSNPNDAVGKQFYPGSSLERLRTLGVTLDIVGVVADTPTQFRVMGAAGTIYQRPVRQAMTPIIRLHKSNLAAGVASIDSVWRQLSPNHILHREFLDDSIEQYVVDRNSNVKLIACIAALALAIAMSGLIGMSIHMANGRRHEIGIRKTLGARTAQILTLLLRDFSKPVVTGNLLAWPLAYIATQSYLNQYIYRVNFSVAPFLLGLVATLTISGTAVAWQAVRAARTRPATVLRND